MDIQSLNIIFLGFQCCVRTINRCTPQYFIITTVLYWYVDFFTLVLFEATVFQYCGYYSMDIHGWNRLNIVRSKSAFSLKIPKYALYRLIIIIMGL